MTARSPTPAFATLSLALALLLAAATPLRAEPPGMRTIETDHGYRELVERVNQAVKDHEMYLVTRASASAGAANRGIQILGNMVIGVYRNDFALRMLEASVPAGYEAPIRFYVTETADGTATLRYRTPSAVFAPYDGGDKLRALAEELDGIFASIAAQATGE